MILLGKPLFPVSHIVLILKQTWLCSFADLTACLFECFSFFKMSTIRMVLLKLRSSGEIIIAASKDILHQSMGVENSVEEVERTLEKWQDEGTVVKVKYVFDVTLLNSGTPTLQSYYYGQVANCQCLIQESFPSE